MSSSHDNMFGHGTRMSPHPTTTTPVFEPQYEPKPPHTYLTHVGIARERFSVYTQKNGRSGRHNEASFSQWLPREIFESINLFS